MIIIYNEYKYYYEMYLSLKKILRFLIMKIYIICHLNYLRFISNKYSVFSTIIILLRLLSKQKCDTILLRIFYFFLVYHYSI